MHPIVGLIKTIYAMTIPNDLPDGPVLLGQRTLGNASSVFESADGTSFRVPHGDAPTSSKDPPDGSGK